MSIQRATAVPKINASSNRLAIFNADDFGESKSVNAAVIEAHRRGCLTTASLMTGGAAWREAAELARQNPALGVGLHVTVSNGKSVLTTDRIPALTDARRQFLHSAVFAGFKYFFAPGVKRQIGMEIEAQFLRFKETGLKLDHINGHLNMHLHPVVLKILIELMETHGRRPVRLTRDPLALNLKLAPGRLAYRLSHAMVFALVCRAARRRLDRHGIVCADRVFGLLQSGAMNEAYLERLLRRLPEGVSEIYSHPTSDADNADLKALTSSSILELLKKRGIRTIRYQDL